MENNEIKIEEFEEAEVFCGDCNGQMMTMEVQRTTPKLFTPVAYKKLVLQCNLCKKTGKPFTAKIKKQ